MKEGLTQIFDFGGKRVRTAGTHEAPLFCAADACAILGIGGTGTALERIPAKDQEYIGSTDAQGKTRSIVFLTEAGLYKLVMRSRKPEAERFVDWVTSEVLPEIRKRGFYDFAKAQNAKRAELVLAEVFPFLPGKDEPIFSQLIAALVELRGEQGKTGTPPWARSLASSVYAWAIPIPEQQKFRRSKNSRRSANSPDYSMLSKEGKDAVKSVAASGAAFAKISVSWEDWRAKMDVAFGGAPLQLAWFAPKRLPGNDPNKGAA